ncbi:MAG TPA: copper-containing nitrite reductase, partial [Candidatus Binataceae bacterium]|nr:copper-containing nitrite reductase [Candidatus Binataceae bacterium]
TAHAVAASGDESASAGLQPAARASLSPKNTRGVAAVPTRIPSPIERDHSIHHEIMLEALEVEAEIEPGAKFDYMTYNGQVPGPMIRVRRGDTVTLTLRSNAHSTTWHSIDLHAVYGPAGGAEVLTVLPGKSKTATFKTMYPGAFIYHCAVPDMDVHMARGMFGMIVVEPEEGLPRVDHEFYIGQSETYTKQRPGTPGPRDFDFDAILREDPTYVVFNGAFNALTRDRLGAMQAKVGESVRIFMVNTGPNLLSSLHPIGNIWSRAWIMGALAMPPMRFLQSVPVPPGNAIVADMELPIPQTIKIVDHAMTRAVSKGAVAEIEVTGEPNPEVFRAET